MDPENERVGGRNELEARRAEQFPNLRNYTLTPGFTSPRHTLLNQVIIIIISISSAPITNMHIGALQQS